MGDQLADVGIGRVYEGGKGPEERAADKPPDREARHGRPQPRGQDRQIPPCLRHVTRGAVAKPLSWSVQDEPAHVEGPPTREQVWLVADLERHHTGALQPRPYRSHHGKGVPRIVEGEIESERDRRGQLRLTARQTRHPRRSEVVEHAVWTWPPRRIPPRFVRGVATDP